MHKYLLILISLCFSILCFPVDSSAEWGLESYTMYSAGLIVSADLAQRADAASVFDASLSAARLEVARAQYVAAEAEKGFDLSNQPIRFKTEFEKRDEQRRFMHSIGRVVAELAKKDASRTEDKSSTIDSLIAAAQTRPFSQTITPLETDLDHQSTPPYQKASLVRRSGVQVIRTEKGLDQIKDWDNGTQRVFFKGREVEPIVDCHDCGCTGCR